MIVIDDGARVVYDYPMGRIHLSCEAFVVDLRMSAAVAAFDEREIAAPVVGVASARRPLRRGLPSHP